MVDPELVQMLRNPRLRSGIQLLVLASLAAGFLLGVVAQAIFGIEV